MPPIGSCSTRELRRAAGIPRLQKLKVSATPGRIILEIEADLFGTGRQAWRVESLDRVRAAHADRSGC